MKLRKQLLLGYVIVLAFMVAIAGVTYQSLISLVDTAHGVAHTYEVIGEAHLIEKLLVDMETGERGFLITGTEEFLEPYNEARERYEDTIASLKEQVFDNPAQVRRLDEIDALTAEWLKVAGEPVITARREVSNTGSSMAEVRALVQKGTGKVVMDALRTELIEFVGVEEKLLAERLKESRQAASQSIIVVVVGTLMGIVCAVTAMIATTRRILRQVGGEPSAIASVTERIAQGDLNVEAPGRAEQATGIAASVIRMAATLKDVARQAKVIATGDYTADVAPRSDQDELGIALQTMTKTLRQAAEATTTRNWLNTGIMRLNDAMRRDPDVTTLASKVVSEMATYLDAQVGALYVSGNGDEAALSLLGTYAYKKRKNLSNVFKPGEGLVGQAALEKQQILVRDVPEDYIRVTSGLGERIPRFICVTPLVYEDRIKGVVELGTLNEMTDRQLEYLTQVVPALAAAVESAEGRTNLAKSLEESQALAEELQAQQEELKTANEELEEQTRLLQQSEERLKAQQEQLQVVNEELEEKNESLDRQRREVEGARRDIADKAEQLAIASKYKSEFLANMSHELRTPLNSLLLLARSFADNTDGNLTGDQVESAHVIYSSGNDLLALINEILDLSKIEAGRMDLHIESVQTRAMADTIREGFQHVADDKGLELDVHLDENAPREIVTDKKRVEQVIKNLMSNAIKFTEQGRVTLRFGRPGGDADLSTSGLAPGNALAIAVSDTGIGMSPEQQKVVFEAFQQAEGGTARKYGGTGLGLSISRELARLLGGEIQLQSVPGEGSTFVLYLPLAILAAEETTSATSSETTAAKTNERRVLVKREEPVIDQIDDDRHQLEPGDKVILIIDDDPNFAKVLMDICRNKGFKVLASASGERGLVTAQEYLPAAIILDIRLPGMDGWTVLDALKDNPATRHIPVHIISVEEATMEALRKGAVGFLTKPVAQEDLADALQKLESTSSTDVKELLVVEDDEGLREHIVSLLANGHVRADEAHTGAEAIRAIESKEYHCMILDLGLPDISGFDLLKDLEKKDITIPPVIVYTGRELTREEEMTLRNYTESIIIKDVRSDERLLDEVSLFLHQVVREMPESKRQIITNLHNTDALLVGKRVLVVDDDMRALFALSRLLTDKGMTPLKAENGEKALRLLNQAGDVDLVLMDIMMPVMDGYETMKRIREDDRFRSLAIIALTAKAMKGDEKRCIAAGANDYLPKPVDPDRLCAMMRVWLYR